MASILGLEHPVIIQQQRLLVLRRQAMRGERHVLGRLRRLERGYFISKRRLKRRRRRQMFEEWVWLYAADRRIGHTGFGSLVRPVIQVTVLETIGLGGVTLFIDWLGSFHGHAVNVCIVFIW